MTSGTQFPANEKITPCNTKKDKNQAALNLTPRPSAIIIAIITIITSSLLTVGTGVIGAATEPIPSQNVYSAQSVLMIVHEAPSLIWSLDAPLAHGVACRSRTCQHE